jgi:two-component system chemotaxis response regulator CheB
MIKILIVDDSETEIAILRQIFYLAKDFEVVGCAKNGEEAVKLVEVLNPDLITMDIQMPIMNGFEATRLIMERCPKPIVVISSKLNDTLLNASFKALEAGALTVIDKPTNIGGSDFNRTCKYIIDVVRGMAEVKVIKRRFNFKKTVPEKIIKPQVNFVGIGCKLIAIGASVGGPQALKLILEKLPKNFSIPIVIVQHMADGFINGFAQWLNDEVELQVKPVGNGEILQPGTVYLAPDFFHFQVELFANRLSAKLVKGPLVSGFCPSITELFKSVAKACGSQSVGVLLTGMGTDGAQGLLTMKTARSHTIIQDKESSVVFGMSSVAQSLHAVDKVMDLGSIANYLMSIAE